MLGYLALGALTLAAREGCRVLINGAEVAASGEPAPLRHNDRCGLGQVSGWCQWAVRNPKKNSQNMARLRYSSQPARSF